MQNETAGWTFGEIRSLLREFSAADVEELIFTEGDKSVAMRRTTASVQVVQAGVPAAGVPAAAPQAEAAGPENAPQEAAARAETVTHEEPVMPQEAAGLEAGAPDGAAEADGGKDFVKAPFAGVFYRAAEPGGEPYASDGAEVKEGDVIGLLEAMKMMNEITSPCDGVIEEIMKQDADFCAYDEPLFRIRRKADV